MQTRQMLSILPDHMTCPENIIDGSLCLDSRQCQPGSVFFAYPGLQLDGRDYIEAAIAAGCVSVIYEEGDDENYKMVLRWNEKQRKQFDLL